MPKEYEYHEGKKAQEDFEEGMKALFQVPKDAPKGKKKPARSGLKTLKVRPANPALPAILARLKASRAFSIRAAPHVCRSTHHSEPNGMSRLTIVTLRTAGLLFSVFDIPTARDGAWHELAPGDA
jgi:hypothetical protein